MSNVLRFPKGKRSLPAFDLDSTKIKEAMPNAATVMGIFAWLFLMVRLALFLVMYWLRLPIVLLCNLVSIPMLFAWLFAWYAFPEKTVMVWGFAVISFLAFTIAWTYDFILMALSPQDMMKTL